MLFLFCLIIKEGGKENHTPVVWSEKKDIGGKTSAGSVRFWEWLRQDSGGTAGMRVQ